MGFHFWYQKMENGGFVRLGCDKSENPWMSVDVYPAMGFKTAGLCYKGEWLQPYQPDWSPLLTMEQFGNTVLFPTPNRVRDGIFTFQGRRVEMRKGGVLKSQHGLAQEGSWRVTNLSATKEEAFISGEFSICPGDENFEAFPYASRLAVTYVLTADGVTCQYKVSNLGDVPMPFGFGLHPWFLLPGKAGKSEQGEVKGNMAQNVDEASLQVPADYCYETTPDLLPTGNMIAVKGDKVFDLNKFRPVRELDLDTVYLTKGRDMIIRYENRGYQLVISQSAEFTAGVVFTAFNRGMKKTGYEVFCVESQTCCTDAINMHEKGFEQSGLIVLEPGAEQAGWVRYTLSDA